ncbi:43 kDa receptor-associated protein of the synapse-like [Lytechinus pictus]|uniref:43 kDa receptor-associated protein of the synapse-like n=1 Tax=Lytechinus pictus TaxID=7653 RepID=UPI00240CFF23|nr:43 kDa receptor-associated protein of the synapse-like [Lytechinus pictus]
MGQRQTRQKVDKGLKLYNARKTEQAVHEWKRVLSKVKEPRLRFEVLGHLAQVYGEWGFAREKMHYAVQQMDIASELESDELKSESYLNLANSNERLCEYHKSLSYARHSLATAMSSGEGSSKLGYVYLALAASNLGFSSFKDSLENLEKAVKMAIEAEDQMLECEAYGCLGDVYKCLKDYDRALKFYVRARELVRCRGQDWPPRLKTHAYLHMATAYRSMRKLDMAMDCGEVSSLNLGKMI